MKEDNLYKSFAKYYDLIYKDKDYKGEVDFIDQRIKNKKIKGRRTIEVACGTGNHTKYFLKKGYNIIAGTDLSTDMLDIYKKKYPKIKTIKADMKRMNLKLKADIVLCLFSSISYCTSKKELKDTFTNFYSLIEKGGILVVDTGFLTFDEKRFKSVKCDGGSEGDIHLFRLNKSTKKGKLLEFTSVYVLFNKDQIDTSKEVHTLGIFDKDTILKTMEEVGFKTGFKKKERRHFFYGIKN